LKKEDKISKLESINHIFEKLKLYEEDKLKTAYEK
jgi:hypothetical protein